MAGYPIPALACLAVPCSSVQTTSMQDWQRGPHEICSESAREWHAASASFPPGIIPPSLMPIIKMPIR